MYCTWLTATPQLALLHNSIVDELEATLTLQLNHGRKVPSQTTQNSENILPHRIPVCVPPGPAQCYDRALM